MSRVIVIGGGASGITAAIFAARNNAEVTVLERENKALKKLAMTGNGKCNLSNLSIEEDSFRSYKADKARSIYDRFGMTDTFAFFEGLGIYMIQKHENCIYPACESAASVCKLLLAEADHLGIKIKTNETVREIKKDETEFTVTTDTWSYTADKVILSSGTHASVSTREPVLAEEFAKKNGLKHYDYLPALTKLYGEGDHLKKWAGVRTFAVIRMLCNDQYVTETYGEIQLTENGISGIPVFQLSRYANIMISKGFRIRMLIDFFPDCDKEQFTSMLLNIKIKCPYKTVKQALLGLLPEKLINAIIDEKSDVPAATEQVKSFSFPVVSLSKVSESQVCTGGIDLGEVTEDLESKKIPGLYITGEALDVDGACGGYNLQWAWTTGALAGKAASGK